MGRTMYIDAHAHIATSNKLLSQVDDVVRDAQEKGVSMIIDSSHDALSSQKALELSRKYKGIIQPTLGIHPEIVTPDSDIYKKDFDLEGELDQLKGLFHNAKNEFVAVGECGLDFYWIKKKPELRSQKSQIQKIQLHVFESQIQVAQEIGLPLVVHSRGAEEECLSMINDTIKNDSIKVLFHSYTGSLEVAKEIFEAGHYISFNNIISYPKSDDIREIFTFGWKNYREQILAETDAPYLPPQHKRGEVCFPSDVRYVIEKLAEISSSSKETVSDLISRNTYHFYELFLK